MSSQNSLIICLVLLVAMILLFKIGKKSIRPPSRLNLKKKSEPSTMVSTEFENESSYKTVKHLNIMFMYNGHSWDAFEVLGVPAGAPLNLVTANYKKLVASSDKDSKEFLDAAYLAIDKIHR